MSQEQNWRDKKKASQKTYVSLDIVETIYPKLNQATGLPELISVKTGQEPTVIDAIQGYIIGEYSKLSAYNNTFKKGGNSTPYFSKNDTVTVYEGKMKIFSGPVEAAKEHMRNHFAVASAKSVKVYILATTFGLKAIETNAVLAMRDNRAIKVYKDDYLTKFVAKLYDPATDFQKGMPENYKSLNIGLRPTFALASQGIPFTQEIEDKLNMNKFMDDFLEFKTFIENNKGSVIIPETTDDDNDPDTSYEVSKGSFGNTAPPPVSSFDAEDDSLPF